MSDVSNLCSICLECIEFNKERSEEPYFLPCMHYFHEKCIYAWLRGKVTCPICRIPIFIKSAEQLEEFNVFVEQNKSVSNDINIIAREFMRINNIENVFGNEILHNLGGIFVYNRFSNRVNLSENDPEEKIEQREEGSHIRWAENIPDSITRRVTFQTEFTERSVPFLLVSSLFRELNDQNEEPPAEENLPQNHDYSNNSSEEDD